MGIPVGYRKIAPNDVGKVFGVDLETVIKFDDTIAVGSWYINDGPVLEISVVEWMLFSDTSNFYTRRAGTPNFWMVDTFFRGSTQSMSEGTPPDSYDYIASTSETVPFGTTIMDLGTLDRTGMNYVYVKDKEPEYTITFNGNGGTSPSSQTTTNQKLTTLPTSTRTGYQFSGGYTATSGGTKITTSTVFSANTTVYARGILEDYTIRFYDYNNSLVQGFEKNYGESITLPTPPTRPGYTFNGWYDSRTETTYHGYNGSGTKITGTTVPDLGGSGQRYEFYAKYTPKQYSLYYSHGFEYSSAVTYNEPYGVSELNSEPYPRAGYNGVGGYDASSGGNKITSTSLVKVVTTNSYIYAYARGTQDPVYTITFSDTKGNSTTRDISSPQNYKVNPLPSASANGFDFQGGYTATSGGTKITTSTVFSANTTVYAQWKPIYTITFSGNGGTSPNSQSVHFDGGYKLTSLPNSTRTNYVFQGWYTATSGGTKITTSTVFNANTTVYAQGIPIYTITFNGNGGTSPSSQTTTNKKLTSLPSSTRTNYVFQGGYTATSGGTKITTSTVFNANTTVYAQGKGTAYTVQFNSNGGGVSSPSSKTVYYGEPYGALATVSRSGYSFVGWFSTSYSGGTQVVPSTVVTTSSPKQLYARGSLTTYIVTYNSNGGTAVSKTFGVTALPTPLPTPTRTGYDFVGWFYEPLLLNKAFAGDALTQNITLYAGWVIKTYTVVFKNWNGSVLKTQTVSHGGNATAPANPTKDSTPQYNYTFNGGDKTFTNVTQNLDIIATYTETIRSYDIGGKANGGKFSNNSTMSSTNHKYGDTPEPNLTLSRDSTAQYHYNTYGGTPPITPVTGEKVYTADWDSYRELRSYDVVFKNGNGSVLKTQSVPYGSSATPPANPTRPQNDEFTFAFSGGVGTYTNITGPATILADYTATKRKYTITGMRNDGTGNSTTTQVNYGANPTPPSLERTGYDFVRGLPEISSVIGEETYTALWAIKTYTITYDLNGGTNVSGNPSTYNVETPSITFLAPTRVGYNFNGWSITNIPKGSTGNKTTTANWIPKKYTITWSGGPGSTLDYSTSSVEYGTTPTAPDGTKTGHNLTGGSPTIVAVTGATTYTAIWTKKTYTVKFFDYDPVNGIPGVQPLKTEPVLYGENATPPTSPTFPGFDFDGGTLSYEEISQNTSIYAKYKPKEYTLTIQTNIALQSTTVSRTSSPYQGAGTSIIDNKIYYGDVLSISAVAKTGYNNPTVTPSVTVQGNIRTIQDGYVIVGAIKTYTVVFRNWDETVLKTQTVSHGSSATAPSNPTRPQTPAYTYIFSGGDRAFTNVTQNLDITATYTSTPRKYNITGLHNDGTGNSTIKQEYYNANPTPPSLQRTGYTFSDGTPQTSPVIGEATYTAQGTIIQYDITYILNGGINNAGNPSTYNVETPLITFLPPTKTGYDFVSWSITHISKGSTGDRTTTANGKFINVPNLNSIANDCAFNSDNQYLVVAHETTPYVTIYKKGTNDTFSKMNLTAPPGKAKSCAFSPDGRYLAIGHQNAPGLTIYKKGTGDSFTKLTMNTIEQNIALSCTFSKDSKYLAVTHLNAPHVTIYETGQGQADIFTKMSALSSPHGDQGSGSSSSFSDENEYLAITYNNSPYVAVIKAQRNPNEKHTFLLNNSFSTVRALLDTPLIELGYASESGTQLQNNKKVKLIGK